MAFYDSWIARPGERVGYLDHAEDGPSVEGVDGALGVTFVVSYFYARISHAFRRRVRNTDLHYGCLFFFRAWVMDLEIEDVPSCRFCRSQWS